VRALVASCLALAFVLLPRLSDTLVDAQGLPVPQMQAPVVEGAMVQLQWTISPYNYEGFYRLEAGTAPGLSDVTVLNIPATYESYTATGVPPGTYFVRVRFRLGDRISAPSNEVGVTVTRCAAPPETPQLTGSVQGQFVDLSWSTTDSLGCRPDRYRIEAGRSTGSSDVAVFEQLSSQFRLSSVPFGDYFVRVRSLRQGIVGPPSNEVHLPVTCLPPRPVPNFRAEVVGRTVTLDWDPVFAPGVDEITTLEVGSSPGATDLASVAVLQRPFIVDGPPGTYYTRIRVNTPCGTVVSNEVLVTIGPEAPPFADAILSGRTLGVSWNRSRTGGMPSSYRIEVGSGRGLADLGSISVTPGPHWLFDYWSGIEGIDTRPAFARVRAVNSCGVSPPSYDAVAYGGEGCAQASPLQGPVATVTGQTATLGWRVGNSEGNYGNWMLSFVEVGRAPQAADVFVSALAGGWQEYTSVQGQLPAGTYYARVRWRYESHACPFSNPSPEISFVVNP
jgi:hypothetical protein